MNWQQRINGMIGLPVGISMADGTGTSGVLCGTENGMVQVLEYLYQKQFALKQYPYYMIQDINTFPSCSTGSGIRPLPFPVPPSPVLY
jgi:hypothetical protein